MCEHARRGGAIYLHDSRLTGSKGSIDLCERRRGIVTLDDGIDANLRVGLTDLIPANTRAREAIHVLQFLVEGLRGFGIAMPAQHHRDTGERATDVANRIGFLLAEAEFVTFPVRVLLGVIDEFEWHRILPLEG